MNWSAFFQGAPAGFSQGMDWSQRFNQNQQMNPLLLQHQQLQNQQMAQMNPLQLQHQQLQNQDLGQNISQNGTNFNREGGAYDAIMKQYAPGQPGMPMPGQHQLPQGTTPTAQPQGQYQDPGNAFIPSSQGPGNAILGMTNPYAGQPPVQFDPNGGPGMLRGRSQPGMDSQNYGASPGTMMVQPWNTYGGYMGNP